MNIIKLHDKAKLLPEKSGCYLMLNSSEEIIYIGKAKSLKHRVSSYFNSSAKNSKTKALISHIIDFEFILTKSDSEAFIVENNLIKKHAPKYNILMRDDRTYPYIVVDWYKKFPLLYYTRKVQRKKKREIIGPFPQGSHLGEVVRIINKIFLLRDCSEHEFNSRKEPCLLFQIKQCSGPCVNLIEETPYQNSLNEALSFLKNKPKYLLNRITEQMHLAAQKEEFERAAVLRDSLNTLTKFSFFSDQKNAELLETNENLDLWSFFIGENEVEWGLYLIRGGKLLGQKSFYFHLHHSRQDISDELINLIYQYYQTSLDDRSSKLFINLDHNSLSLLQSVFKSIYDIKVEKYPIKYKNLNNLVTNFLIEKQKYRIISKISEFEGLNLLQELLCLKESPRLLECYDIALFQGSSPSSSQIVFKDGKPLKQRYRHYKLKELPEGNNDFAMMRETLERRLKYGEFPDLFIVDGGLAQVNIFFAVLKEFKLDIPVVGIAKSRNKVSRSEFISKKTEERLIIPGRLNPFILKKHRGLLKLLTSMRDEAHRFSRRLHHKLEHDRILKSSWLDSIFGIGPITKKKILSKGMGQKEILKLTTKEIQNKFSITLKQATAIKNCFK